jgi:hypothetical protein
VSVRKVFESLESVSVGTCGTLNRLTRWRAPISEVHHVDSRKPPPVRPGQASLPQRPDGRRVGMHRSLHSARETRWTPARGQCPGGAQRRYVCAEYWLPNGVIPRKIYLPGARCTIISNDGTTTAHWGGSITPFIWRVGSRSVGRSAQPPA